MQQIQSSLHRFNLWLAVLVVAGIGAAVTLAQQKAAAPPSAAVSYDYAGVGGSLVRVERDSGRVEILEQRSAPGMSLTLEQGRPWTWREIRIDKGPGRPPNHDSREGQRPGG